LQSQFELKEMAMKYIILVKATRDSEAGKMPSESLLAEMGAYHEQLAKAGVLVDGSGLQRSAKGWRIKYNGKQRSVVDGTVRRDEELVAGYTIINVEVARGSAGVDQALPEPVDRRRRGRDRGAAVLRARGLRRQPGGRALPQAGRGRIAMLKTIGMTAGIGAAVVVGGVLVAAAMRPDSFQVRRSATINAAPEKIFPLINDLHRFNSWNPFEKKDPNLKRSYSGPESGKGATYAFEGNSNVGKGTLEILDSAPASKVTMALRMLEPFESAQHGRLCLATERRYNPSHLAMQGSVPYLAKIIHLFIDMDRMVGTEFEAGLASLKTLAEKTQ